MRLKSVTEYAAAGPFSEGQLRWWIFNATTNGLDEVAAIVRVQRRVYVDIDRFEEWILRQNSRTETDRNDDGRAKANGLDA